MPQGKTPKALTKEQVKEAADRAEARARGETPKPKTGPLNPPETARERGRPTDYRPEFVRQAEQLCVLGATDVEIADFFNVDVRTIYRWKLAHTDFCQALQIGKDIPDSRVVRSLYQRSLGTYVTEEQAVKVKVGPSEEKVEVVKVQKYVPPDTTAMIFWLKNRRSKDWRDVRQHEVGGPGDFNDMTDDDLIAEREKLRAEIQRHLDEEDRTLN